MSLQAKRYFTVLNKGLIVLLALFLWACEDPNELGADLNPFEGRGTIRYAEVIFPVEQVLMDTLFTSQGEIVLSGTYTDQDFGKISTEGYLHFVPALPNAFPADSATLDSVKISLRASYFYGNQFNFDKTFKIFQLEDTIGFRELNNNQNLLYTDNLLAEGSFRIAAGSDTTLIFRSENEVFTQIFDLMRERNSIVNTQSAFDAFFKGFAIVSGAENDAVIGFRTNDTSTGVRFYFRYPSDTVSRNVLFQLNQVQNSSFIQSDRSGTQLEVLNTPLEAIEIPGDYVYFQSGIGIIPKLDIRPFKNFSDTVSNLILLKAELEISEPVRDMTVFKPVPTSLVYYLTDERNTIITAQGIPRGINEPGVDAVIGGRPVFTPFNGSRNGYFTDATLFFQAYYDGRILNEDLLVFSERMNIRVNQLKVKKENIKLKLYYISG